MLRRLYLPAFLLFTCLCANAQIGWIAPEGKILNYRTLLPTDYLGKPDKHVKNVSSFIVPALYYTAYNPQTLDNGRLTWDFTVKCAFQSQSWVYDESEQGFFHQQNHYDLSLLYSNMLRAALVGKDFSPNNYQKELDAIHDGLWKKLLAADEAYQTESEQGNNKQKELLWAMRIKKCYENATDEFMYSPESVVQSVRGQGQMVKRLPDESAKVFATRCRPLYSWYTDEMGEKTIESTEWSEEKAVVAFYTQKYKLEKEDPKIKDGKRILAYLFMPAGKGLYKRIFIDTFSNDEKPVTITSAFFANADSDPAKELVILTTTPWRDPQSNGTLYTTYIYDNIPGRPFPARLKSLDEAANKVAGGLDGMSNNKATRPKCKNEKDVREALKKLGME